MAADQGGGFEQYRRATKRDVFLATMNEIVPWQELCAVIEPHYPKPGNEHVGERLAGALSRHVDETELREAAHRGPTIGVSNAPRKVRHQPQR